jgi:hypothetical protein
VSSRECSTNTLQLGTPAPGARRAFPRIFRLAGLSWRPRVRPARRVGSSHIPSQARPQHESGGCCRTIAARVSMWFMKTLPLRIKDLTEIRPRRRLDPGNRSNVLGKARQQPSSIFRLHKNMLAPHLHEFLRHVLAVRAASDNHCLDRWDLQTDAVECVTKQGLPTHDFR